MGHQEKKTRTTQSWHPCTNSVGHCIIEFRTGRSEKGQSDRRRESVTPRRPSEDIWSLAPKGPFSFFPRKRANGDHPKASLETGFLSVTTLRKSNVADPENENSWRSIFSRV